MQFNIKNWLYVFLFLTIEYHTVWSFNPAATAKVLGYLSDVDTRLRMMDFWKKFLFGSGSFDEISSTEIFSGIQNISIQLKNMDMKFDQKLDIATTEIPKRIRADAKVDAGINDLVARMHNIDILYESDVVAIMSNRYDDRFLRDFVNKALSVTDGPLYQIGRIYKLLYPDRTSSIEQGLIRNINDRVKLLNNERCDEDFSPQRWLHNIFMNLIITEIRAYFTTVLAYSVDTSLTNVSHELVMNGVTEEFLHRINNHILIIRTEMSTTPRWIRRCDPKKHIRGETFIELERLVQAFIMNEDQFHYRIDERRCSACTGNSMYAGSDMVKREEFKNDRVFQSCNGSIYGCLSFELGANLHWGGEVCMLPEGNAKRYGYIKSGLAKKTYGDGSQCSGSVVPFSYHAYKSGGVAWLSTGSKYECRYCLCRCEETNPLTTIRTISARNQTADYKNNMVITGVRLVEVKQIVHLQIKQGKLISNGRIEAGSENWVELEDMDILTKEITEIMPDRSTNTRKMGPNADYIFVDQYDKLIILEDLMAPKGSLIVGIGFKTLEHRPIDFKGIELQIMTAPFDWNTGKLGKAKWFLRHPLLHPFIQAAKAAEITKVIAKADDPLRSKINLPDLENSVLKFIISDLDKDASQSVVPFIDSLPVETKPSVPIAGIGLIHKGAPGFGGFITPRIHNVDYTDYI